eukprot:scaffold9753_cov160-Amphora_coffeaeformis.AAC.1
MEAQPFLDSIYLTKLTLQHSTINIDWQQSPPMRRRAVVEGAVFPLMEHVRGRQFVQDAKATTPVLSSHTGGTASNTVTRIQIITQKNMARFCVLDVRTRCFG